MGSSSLRLQKHKQEQIRTFASQSSESDVRLCLREERAQFLGRAAPVLLPTPGRGRAGVVLHWRSLCAGAVDL